MFVYRKMKILILFPATDLDFRVYTSSFIFICIYRKKMNVFQKRDIPLLNQ